MKKLIPAFALLLVSAVLMSTASFAWFSMNNTVTVTGMEIRTKVGDNLLIANDTLDSVARKTDDLFKNSLVQTTHVAVVEPVSTINGTSFFYTANDNVQGNGDAINETYVAYDRTTNAGKNAFDGNYGEANDDNDEDCVGYVDYVFQLKAINGATASDIRLTKLDLTYGGTADAGKAYRVAMFVEDITSANPAGGVGTLKAIFTPNGAANFSAGKAVSAVDALSTVTYNAAAANGKMPVGANEAKYFKVVIRLWLEGEDTTCNNTTYMTLSDVWSLDLEFQLTTTTDAVTYINNGVTAAKTVLTIGTDDGLDAGAVTINGVTYYPIDGKKLGSDDLYVATSKTLAANSLIYTINGVYPIDVTNQVSIVTP